ncbi:uncharacterized protein LOC111061660 isoform X2 [Nilaparvata lugens]|uniref:uncharacterized protein LOC111061660 isoform X2 n=1 Tax=Nilaparvata lugens TaxID=108931 RepID=UPI00193CF2F8|nr:uncharacterized protein LOC111061660 isoform X2 [Nilaparvata lugens]
MLLTDGDEMTSCKLMEVNRAVIEENLQSSWEVDTKWTSQPQNNISNFYSAATPSSSAATAASY